MLTFAMVTKIHTPTVILEVRLFKKDIMVISG